MRLKVFPSCVDYSHHVLQAFAPAVPNFLFFSSTKKHEKVRTASLIRIHPLVSRNPLKSQTFEDTVSRGHRMISSCSLNSEGIYNEEPSFCVKNFDLLESEGRMNKDGYGGDRDWFLNPRFDFLEPMMLGIRPDVPDWPDRETVTRVTIEQKVKNLDIPLSLRMIKKKIQIEEGYMDFKESDYCSVKGAFSSMVFIIVALQSYALHMRETLCHENLEIIIAKAEKEMHSSFVWLFQQVFSKTPSLMIYIMILLANFGVHSVSSDIYTAFNHEEVDLSISSISISRSDGGIVDDHLGWSRKPPNDSYHWGSVVEMNLWNSIVDEATKMQEFEVEVLDHDTRQHFVSPLSLELGSDGNEDYLRTDLLYQMHLSYEPDHPLLLSNYGQFLHLITCDYDRAEECFKRAIQILPVDPESIVQYANFLWTVRKDFLGAEERFLQALATNPDNSYYASRYANFLWSTGGEETCFPLDNLHNPNL